MWLGSALYLTREGNIFNTREDFCYLGLLLGSPWPLHRVEVHDVPSPTPCFLLFLKDFSCTMFNNNNFSAEIWLF